MECGLKYPGYITVTTSLDNSLINNGSNGVPKMKNLILLIAVYLVLFLTVFSVLFVLGCQENAITDPLYTESPGGQVVTNETADKDIPRDFTDHPKHYKISRKT